MFVDANRHYWTDSTTFVQGACGVINAAADLGYNLFDVHHAFDAVGVRCDNYPTKDSDADGLPDLWEHIHGLDHRNAVDAHADPDQDGLSNRQEFQLDTLPGTADSDNDGLPDGQEVNDHKTNPVVKDSDGDGIEDGVEVRTLGTHPLSRDTDQDGMDDGWEVANELNPLLGDSQLDFDGDGRTNITEYNGFTLANVAELTEVAGNNNPDSALPVQGYFNRQYSRAIGDQKHNTSTQMPHVTVVGSGDNTLDFYVFDVSFAPNKVILDMDTGLNNSYFDSELALFDSNGRLLEENDDMPSVYGQAGSDSEFHAYLEYTFTKPRWVVAILSESAMPALMR